MQQYNIFVSERPVAVPMSALNFSHRLRHSLALLALLLVLGQLSMEVHWHLHDDNKADCSVCVLSHGTGHAHTAPLLLLPQPAPQTWLAVELPAEVILQPRTSVRSRAPPAHS